MSGWLEKLRMKLGSSEPGQSVLPQPDGADPSPPDASPGSGPAGPDPNKPEDLTDVTIMIEILKLLARIEYGVDEVQVADALAVSQAYVLANCRALEDEVLIHQHGTSADWFIGQRGLDFLRLHGHLE